MCPSDKIAQDFYCSWVWFMCIRVCVPLWMFQIYCYFAKAMKSFIKSGTPYIWMHDEMGYMVSIWSRRPLTKEPEQQNDSWSSVGLHCIKLILRDQCLVGISSSLEQIQHNYCCWRTDEIGAFSGLLHIQCRGCRLGSSYLWWIPDSSPNPILFIGIEKHDRLQGAVLSKKKEIYI